MSKKNKKAENTANTNTDSTIINPETVTVTPDSKTTEALTSGLEGLTLPKGRPVNANSARQIKIAAMAAKREAGELHRGRPTDPNSKRQLKIANKGEGKTGGSKGRPVDMNSARQKQIAARNEKLIAYKAQLDAAATVTTNPEATA